MPILVKLVKQLSQILILSGLVLCLTLGSLPIFPAIAQPNPQALLRLELIQQRFTNLEDYVSTQNWTTIKTYIHGPFGNVRQDIQLAIAGLATKEKTIAKNLTKQFVADLVKIDFAVSDRDIERTEAAFEQARKDFEELVNLIVNS
jgi:photosystem II protein PsbQ